MTTANLKFTKTDEYGNWVFFVTEPSDGDDDKQQETFERLAAHAQKLKKDFPDSYSPLFHSKSSNIIIIRINSLDRVALKKECLYEVRYKTLIRKKRSTGESYVVLCATKKPRFIRSLTGPEVLYDYDSVAIYPTVL